MPAGRKYGYKHPKSKRDGAVALRKVNKLTRELGRPEYKFLRTDIDLDPDAAPGAILGLVDIGVGDTASQREGQRIRLKSIELSGVVNSNATGTITNLRILVVRDNSTVAADPTWTDIYATVADAANNGLKDGTLFVLFILLG